MINKFDKKDRRQIEVTLYNKRRIGINIFDS